MKLQTTEDTGEHRPLIRVSLEREPHLQINSAVFCGGPENSAGQGDRLSEPGGIDIADRRSEVLAIEKIARRDAEGQVVTPVCVSPATEWIAATTAA